MLLENWQILTVTAYINNVLRIWMEPFVWSKYHYGFTKMAVGLLLFQVPVATYQTEAPTAPGMGQMIGFHPLP